MQTVRTGDAEPATGLCVYTVLVGGYERLNRQPFARPGSIPFICLTDDPDLSAEGWQMRVIRPLFPMDAVRSQRDAKIRPHLYLPDQACSIYIDNSVILEMPPEALWAQFDPGAVLALHAHSFRDRLADEFLEVARLGMDDASRIFEQLNHTALSHPALLQERPWWGGLMLRRHDDPALRRMAEIWAAHVHRYARRDQLSLQLACREAGVTPQLLPGDNHRTSAHRWPVTEGRAPRRWPQDTVTALMPPPLRQRTLEATVAEAARLEAQRAQLAAELAAMRRSFTWRLTTPLRVLGRLAGRDGARLALRLMPERLADWARAIRRVRGATRAFDGTTPSLFRPRSFNHKMQWRKLFELDPIFAVLLDKIAARDFVGARIGPGRQAPLLWTGTRAEDIPFDTLTPPYVLKSNHASGHMILVQKGETPDRDAIRRTAAGWLQHCHGSALNEPGYIHIPRRLLVEAWLGRPDGSKTTEYKLFCFGGRAEIIQTIGWTAEGQRLSMGTHTRDWDYLPIRMTTKPAPVPPARPDRLPEMIDIAERLSAGLSHARVDLYDCGDRLLVGEITLYSYSGLAPFQDRQYDLMMGDLWKIERPAWRALRTILSGRWEIRPPAAE